MEFASQRLGGRIEECVLACSNSQRRQTALPGVESILHGPQDGALVVQEGQEYQRHGLGQT